MSTFVENTLKTVAMVYAFALLLLLPFNVSADTVSSYSSYSINVEEGLSSNIVYSILKWKDNNIWMATRQGIDKYDGFSFKHYSIFSNDLRLVGNGAKISISYDGLDQLWAYTDGGQIYFYDIEKDDFQQFLSLSDIGVYSTLNSLTQIGPKLYACTTDGIVCLDGSSGDLISMGARGEDIKSIRKLSSGQLIAGGSGCLYVLEEDLKSSKSIDAARDLKIEFIFIDNEFGQVILGCYGNGIWKYDHGAVSRIGTGLDNAVVRCITKFGNDGYLIGCDGGGVYKADTDWKGIDLFASDIVPPGTLSLKTSSVYSILVDDGNVWVACYRGGVTLFRKDADFILIRDEDEKVASENFVHGACGDAEGNLWIAFNSHIGRYDSSSRIIRKYIDNHGFLAVSIDDHGDVWCGGYNTGLYRINAKTGNGTMLPSLSGNAAKDCVSIIAKDPDGNIWVGGLNFNLTRINCSDGLFNTRQYDISKVFSIVPISLDTLLIGSSFGLSILDQKTGVITTPDFSESLNWKGTMLTNSIAYSEETGDVWIGTDGGGLMRYNLHDRSATPFTTRDGLPSNYIMGVEIDGNQRLWVSTENSGIFVFDTREGKVATSVKKNEGLFFNEFFPGSSSVLPNGDIIFGGNGGAIIIPAQTKLGKVEIGNVTVTNLMVGVKNIPFTNKLDHITLPFKDRSFALSISTDNLYNQHSVQLSWRLLGYSKEWQVVSADRTIKVNNLPPGKYTLEIIGEQIGDEAIACRSIQILSEQTIWLRWYFILLYIMSAALIVFWVFSLARHRLEKQQFEEKIKFFANVAHDVKNPLMLISAPLSKLVKIQSGNNADEEQLRLVATANNNVKKLENLVSQLMDFEKLSSGKVKLDTQVIDLGKFVEMIKYDYQLLAEEKSLNFQVSTLPQRYYVSTDTAMLGRVLDNLLSNAIKYTMEGSVTLAVYSNGDHAVIEVSDTGIGMSQSTARKLFRSCFRGDNAVAHQVPGNGFGLFFINTIVKIIGGSLSFKSKLNEGSSFYLSLPLCPSPAEEKKELEAASSRKSAGFSSNRETILFVDDNNDLREFLSHSLSGSYNVVQAADAEAALEILGKNSVDLIISDLIMPGMHGDMLCKHIKSHLETSHIPVILFTAVTDKEAMATGLSVGADDYITKPVDLDILSLKIRNIFLSRQKLQSYFLSTMSISPSKEDPHIDSKQFHSDLDNTLLQRILKAVQENLSNSEFAVNDLCREVAVSRTLLYEKTRKLLGLAPNDLIREMRMKQAKHLLEDGNISVTDVAYQCGFSDVRYFSTVFKKYYGISPSNVRQSVE